MTDINHTDLEANGGIPLSQPWERVAAKELSDISHYLTHGLFINPADFAERLRQAADSVEDWVSDIGTHPQRLTGAELDVLGIHVAAVSIAAEEIATLVNVNSDHVSADLLKRGRMLYESCTPVELQQQVEILIQAAEKTA